MNEFGPSKFPTPRSLERAVVSCRRCPRLVRYRENVEPRKSYSYQEYWRRPVPGFGDLKGRLLVLGLAPAVSGGNRTGRVFTGDSSGRFLVKALFEAGFANQPASESKEDGLVYTDCYLTAAVKCVPPGDRPLPSEFENCSDYLDAEINLMTNLRSVLTLGSMAFRAYISHLKRMGVGVKGIRFEHGRRYLLGTSPVLYASYHPSPRNTNTGKLTQSMLLEVLKGISRGFQKA